MYVEMGKGLPPKYFYAGKKGESSMVEKLWGSEKGGGPCAALQ